MPTGYTAKLYEGEPQSFAEFAQQCARAFVIEMRDAPADAALPQKSEISTYHYRGFLKALTILNADLKRTTPQWEEAEQGDRSEDEFYNAEQERKAAEIKVRYETMLRQVCDWKPPTDKHEGIQKFMIEQLESSIKHDCDVSYLKPKPKQTVEEYRDAQVSRALKDMTYHWEHWLKDVERVTTNTAWIQAFQDSLKEREDV